MNNEHIHHTLYSCCDSNISDEAIFSIRFHFTINKNLINVVIKRHFIQKMDLQSIQVSDKMIVWERVHENFEV